MDDKIKSIETEEASKLIHSINDNLSRADDVAIIPEHLYNSAFKPYLEDGEEVKDDNPILSKWVELAGGVHNEVKVVDSTGKSKIIPPLLNTDRLDRDASRNINYSLISSEFELQRSRHAAAGDNYLNGQLKGVADIIIKDKPVEPIAVEKSIKDDRDSTVGNSAYDDFD